MTLAEFLRARLDEDEATARRQQAMDAEYEAMRAAETARGIVPAVVVPPFSEIGSPGDPDRVLAEVDAKRQIVEAHERDVVYDGDRGEFGEDIPCLTLRLLALPYDSHPGYREEWRPRLTKR